MRCSLSSIALFLSFNIYITDAQKQMKSKVHVMEDSELAALLNDMPSQKKTATLRSRSLPFIHKQPNIQEKSLRQIPHEPSDREGINSKVHYISDNELEDILNYLQNDKTKNMPPPPQVVFNDLEPEKSVLGKPRLNINDIDNLPLQDYSKVYLVVDPDAIKNTDNQKTLTDLIGKVIAARRSYRRDHDNYEEDRNERDNKRNEREDSHREREERNRDRERERDRESRKESKASRDEPRYGNKENSRTARPISRGADREQRKFSDLDD